MEQSFFELVLRRRSIRKFDLTRQLPQALAEQITQAGRFAPSGGNHQLNHFLVVRNPQILAELKALVREGYRGWIDSERYHYPSILRTKELAQKDSFDFMFGAPMLILVANRRENPNNLSDSAAALENMLLAATALDLAACWVNQVRWLADWPEMVQYLETLGIGKDEVVCGGMAVGYPALPEPPRTLPRTGNRVDWLE